MSTSTTKDPNTERVPIQAFVPRELDAEIERRLAGTGKTKREFVENAIRRALARKDAA